MENMSYPRKVALEPGRKNELITERVKYQLDENSEWLFVQTRCLDHHTRVVEYFQDPFYEEKIDVPSGVVIKKHLSEDSFVVVQEYILPDYDTDYSLEHDELKIVVWQKAIVLDKFLLSQPKEEEDRDRRRERRAGILTDVFFVDAIIEEEQEEEMPGLV